MVAPIAKVEVIDRHELERERAINFYVDCIMEMNMALDRALVRQNVESDLRRIANGYECNLHMHYHWEVINGVQHVMHKAAYWAAQRDKSRPARTLAHNRHNT